MSDLIMFDFEGGSVRMAEIDATMHFVAKDVADRLGYADAVNAIKRHCKGVAKRHPLSTAGGIQEVRVLAEPDVMRLIINSKLPAAERFERLVFEEILPTIRRTGSFGRPRLSSKEATAAMAQVRLCKGVFGAAHARALWREIGLPYAEPTPEDVAATRPRERPAHTAGSGLTSPLVPPLVAATAEAVMAFLDRPDIAGKWIGTPTDLLRELLATGVSDLPQTSASLGLTLHKVRGILSDRGVSLARMKSGARRVIIQRQSRPGGRA